MKTRYLNKFVRACPSHFTPKEHIQNWLEVEEEIEGGYNWIPPELDNEVGMVRDPIQKLIENKELKPFKEHEEFIKSIEEIDDRIKVNCHVNKRFKTRYWWDDIVLKEAREVYCNFAWIQYKHLKVKLII